MNSAELKKQIMKEEEYFDLSEQQIIAIEKAITQLENKEGIPHNEVMKKIRKKYISGIIG